MYNHNTKSPFELLNSLLETNEAKVNNVFYDQIKNSERMIDIQCKIASYFIGWWNSGVVAQTNGNLSLTELLFSSFHKNILSFYSALKLNSLGLYGSVRPLLRNIFEWLMISKFSSISDNTKVLEKWEKMETIYFSNAILKKIKAPSSKPFFEFWSIICEYTHATKYSMQVSLDVKKQTDFRDILGNYAVINALLECNYHLLNTHLITSECENMGKFYFGSNQSDLPTYDVPTLRKEAHSIFKANRSFTNKELITFISTYKRKWKLSQ